MVIVLRIPSEFKLLSLSDFRDLLDNQWLCRAWTFQELILSSDPVIVCGQRFCDWATFYQGIDILYDERPTFKGFGWLSRLWKYRKRLWADTLPFEVVAPWQDLMSFYELISRPISWHGRQQRILPADQTWTIDKYHHEYMRGSLRQSLWLASSIPLSLILLDVCFMLLHPAFLPKSTLLYLAFPVIPLWIFGWSLFVDNQFMHIRSDQQSISLLWSKLKSLDITSRKMGGTVNGISYSYSLGKSSTPADSIATARLGKVLRDHRSTNAKDQSFAVHGILRRLGIEQSTPDYSKSLATVYTELYKAMLSQRPSMINLLAETGDSSLKAPSWTPDWSTISGRAWLPTSFLYEPPWDFLSDHKPQPMISGDRLIVQGVIRPGKIVYCSKPFPTMEMLDELSDQTELDNQLCKVLMSLVEWLSMIARYHPGGISRPRHFRAIINTLLINQMPFIQCRPWKKTTEDRALQLALHCVDEIFKGFESRQVRNRDYNTLLRSLYEESKYMQTFLRLCCAEFGGKRIFFVTDKGSLGTGLAAMRQGDKVANIVGVSVPLILRESGSYWRSTSNGYRVIGPAFMDQLLIWARERNTMRGLSEDATTPSSLENAARWAEQRQCSYDSSVTYDDIVLS